MGVHVLAGRSSTDEGTEYWQFCFGSPQDPADLKQKIDLYESAYAHIMGPYHLRGHGRSLANGRPPFLRHHDAARKVVLSRTLKEAEWAKPDHLPWWRDRGDRKLRRGGDGHIVVWGGVGLWRSLMRARLDLIDEIRLDLHPYVAGEGTWLFDDDPKSYRTMRSRSPARGRASVLLADRKLRRHGPTRSRFPLRAASVGCRVRHVAQ